MSVQHTPTGKKKRPSHFLSLGRHSRSGKHSASFSLGGGGGGFLVGRCRRRMQVLANALIKTAQVAEAQAIGEESCAHHIAAVCRIAGTYGCAPVRERLISFSIFLVPFWLCTFTTWRGTACSLSRFFFSRFLLSVGHRRSWLDIEEEREQKQKGGRQRRRRLRLTHCRNGVVPSSLFFLLLERLFLLRVDLFRAVDEHLE